MAIDRLKEAYSETKECGNTQQSQNIGHKNLLDEGGIFDYNILEKYIFEKSKKDV